MIIYFLSLEIKIAIFYFDNKYKSILKMNYNLFQLKFSQIPRV